MTQRESTGRLAQESTERGTERRVQRRDPQDATASPNEARTRFEAAAHALDADESIRLAETVLWIAAEHETVDVAGSLRDLDSLAARTAERLTGIEGDAALVASLVEALGQTEGFYCDFEQFDDPRNSFLNQVLERRTGLPILLALVYIEVGRRVGLDLHGLGTPARFLVRAVGETDLIIDPAEGRVLSDAQCTRLFRELLGRDDVVFSREALRAATQREFLIRVLNNLRTAYVRREAWSDALLCCERVLLLLPDAPEELCHRSVIYEKLECFLAARSDLERFLELYPEHPGVEVVQERLEELSQNAPTVH